MNSKIEFARKCAMAILKPSRKDLEHGLELHKHSTVFDAYSFSPASSVDGDIMIKAWKDGASQNELRDISEEMIMTRHVFNEELYKEYLEAWEASGVTCVFQNAGEESNDPMQIIKRFARFTYVTDYMVKKFGADYVAIGTDCGYSSMKYEAEYKKVESVTGKSRNRWEALWPEGSLCHNFDENHTSSLSWTNWPLFTVGLVQRGHSDDVIRKIIGGNVMRVINAVLKN